MSSEVERWYSGWRNQMNLSWENKGLIPAVTRDWNNLLLCYQEMFLWMVDNTYTHKLWSCAIYHFLNQCWGSLFCCKQSLQFLHWEVRQDLLIGTRAKAEDRSQKQNQSTVINVRPQFLCLLGLFKSYWQELRESYSINLSAHTQICRRPHIYLWISFLVSCFEIALKATRWCGLAITDHFYSTFFSRNTKNYKICNSNRCSELHYAGAGWKKDLICHQALIGAKTQLMIVKWGMIAPS